MELKDFINSIRALPKTSEDLLLTAFETVRLPKGYCPLHEHKRSNKAFVIKEGIAHAFAFKKGKAATFWIGQEGDVIYPGQSLFHGREYGTVELLEDCVLYELDLNKLLRMYQKDVYLANWGRVATEKVCIALEKSILSRQFRTTLERYKELLAEYPGIIKRVPLHIIASYLNTSQENLSRIRRNIR